MLQQVILDNVRHPFVIYNNVFTNKQCLSPQYGKTNKRAMIISLPCSGVHLMQEIFDTIGLSHVRVAYEKDCLHDYRFLSDTDRITYARNSDNYAFSFDETYNWIIDGQFTHTNMGYDERTYLTLRDSDFMVYLLKRNLRDCVVSHARYKQRSKMCFQKNNLKLMETYISSPFYNEILERVNLMLPWFTNETFEVIKFESLCATNGKSEQYQTIVQLLEDFEVFNVPSDNIIDTCIGKQTFTYSGEISDWRNYWNNDIEQWFIDTGLKKLNTLLGYN